MAIFHNVLTTLGKFFKKSKRRKKAKKKTLRKRKTVKSKNKPSRRAGVKKKKTVVKKKKTAVKKKKSAAKKRKTVVRKKKGVVKKKRPAQSGEVEGVLIGEITHYFSKISVCVVKMTRNNMRVGDKIRIKGNVSDFIQNIKSLQVQCRDSRVAGKGPLVGLKVNQIAWAGDKVYKVSGR